MRAFIVLLAVAFVSGDAVNDLCPPNNGDLPVYLPGEDCSNFYECSNGIAHVLHCPDGLQYNAKLNVCDWPESAGCEGSGDNTTEQPTETTPSENTTEESSEDSKEGQSTEKSSEESNENSRSSADSNEGKSSEESNDKSNDGQSTEVSTEQSEESNENSKSSEDSKEGKSSDESNDKSSDGSSDESDDDELIRKACESNEFFLIPHPSDCGKYISCNHGKPYVMPCPKGLNFSPLLRICLPPEQAQCQTN